MLPPMEAFTAVIPVRSGSQRLKDKNIQPFAGSNLLLHKIRQLKKVPAIKRVVVASDSDQYLAMAKEEGVETFKMSAEYCDGATKSFGEMIAYVCENVSGEHVVWAQCTSPLVTPEIYTDAIVAYEANVPPHDSLASVEVVQKHIWDDKGPVNYERGKKHPRSQDLPRWYFVTGVFIAPRAKMIEWMHNIGPNPYKYPLQKINSIDIDDELDLEIARHWHDRACDCLRG